VIISSEIEERQAELDAFILEYFGPDEPVPGPPPVEINYVHRKEIPDQELIVKIEMSKQADLFRRLFNGNIEGYGSNSEADLSLCNLLAFWTGKNPEQMDRLFRRSGLMRSKWDEKHGQHTYGAITIAKAIADCTGTYTSGQQSQQDPEEWEEPISLNRPDLPKFDSQDFPAPLWAMIDAVAKATETPVELSGLISLSVAAAAVQKKLEIEPELKYREPLCIWTVSVLPPGSRKSAAQKPFIKPLQAWEIEQSALLEPVIKAATAKRTAEELRLKELQKRYAKEDDEIKRAGITEEMDEVQNHFTEIPARPQVFTQDVTPERLGALMADNYEAMAIFSAEGGIFDTIGGRYSSGVPNLDLFLQSHSGDTVRVDRGSRPPVWMQSPALTMGLSVQDDVMQSMAGKQGFKGRGLIGRFQYASPVDLVGRRKLITQPVPDEIEQAYTNIITNLLNIPVTKTSLGETPAIPLSAEALRVWKTFQRWVEDEMAEGGSFDHMRDYAGKLPGAAARIAGIFHCVAHCTSDRPDFFDVSPETMQRAVSLATKLSQHAVHVYDLMGTGGDIQAARKILRWIEKTGAESFTARDCHCALKGTFPKREDLNPGLNVLMERGYIRRTTDQCTEKKAGRKSEFFGVNPFVHKGVL